MPVLMPQGKQQFFDSAGDPLVGGKVYTYSAGTNTPLATYPTNGDITTNPNPVILDGRGEATIFWQGSYKVVLTDLNDVVIWTVDNIISTDTAAAADELRADLADTSSASNGAGLVGFLPTLSYASNTVGGAIRSAFGRSALEITAGVTPTNYFYPVGVVERYGAAGDGTTDDSPAFATAFSLASIGTRPGYVKTTPGRSYSVADLVINGPNLNNNTRGEYSLVFDFSGSTLIGRSTATVILRIGSDTGTTTWANGVKVICGTMDMTAMTDASTRRGLEMRNSYKNDISGLVVMGEGGNKIGFYVRDRAYTTVVSNLSCLRTTMIGVNLINDYVSTFTFINIDTRKLTLTNCSSIKVMGGAIQNDTGDKVAMTDVFDITFDTVDIEGAAGTAYAALNNNCSFLRIIGGNITGALAPFTGEFNGSDLGPIRYRGEYHNLYGRPLFNVNGSGPFTIWAQTGDVTSGGVSTATYIYTITGTNGSDGFSDEVKVWSTFLKVLDSWTTYGSPATRTYSLSGTNLRVSFSSPFVSNLSVAVRVIPA